MAPLWLVIFVLAPRRAVAADPNKAHYNRGVATPFKAGPVPGLVFTAEENAVLATGRTVKRQMLDEVLGSGCIKSSTTYPFDCVNPLFFGRC